MRIGIDARQLSGPMIGTRRALESVLREWLRTGLNDHDVFLYSPKKFELSFHHPFHCRIGSGVGKLIGGTVWLQTELPCMVTRDALDVFWATTDILPLPITAKIPCLLTVQDLGYYEIPEMLSPYVRGMYRLFFRPSLRAATRIICTTAAIKYDLEKMGLSNGNLTVVHHGVDKNRFVSSPTSLRNVLARYGLVSGFFLYVGHLRPNKNLKRTLLGYKEFLARAQGQVPLFVLVGGRSRNDTEIMDLIEGPLRSHVRYLGYLPEDELAALYSGALAFVSPSVYEGFGLPYLEAMAAELPVMAPDIPVVSEVCGKLAVYVDPRSVTDIALAFERLHNEGGNATLRRSCRDWAKTFGWDRAASRILQILQELKDHRTSAGGRRVD